MLYGPMEEILVIVQEAVFLGVQVKQMEQLPVIQLPFFPNRPILGGAVPCRLHGRVRYRAVQQHPVRQAVPAAKAVRRRIVQGPGQKHPVEYHSAAQHAVMHQLRLAIPAVQGAGGFLPRLAYRLADNSGGCLSVDFSPAGGQCFRHIRRHHVILIL